jgi:hypothetical protein
MRQPLVAAVLLFPHLRMTDPNRSPAHLKTLLAASYARTATEDERGLNAQHALNVQKAIVDQYSIPDEPAFRFQDYAVSGRDPERDGLTRLIAVVMSGNAPFSRIYIKDETRIGRFDDPRCYFGIRWLLERHGVELRRSG